MKEHLKPCILILVFLALTALGYAAGDWNRTVTVKYGRTDPDCDVESPGKSLAMFGGQYEFWYDNLFSIGPYVYFSQLHSGPLSWQRRPRSDRP
jgi:hypothetical protein